MKLKQFITAFLIIIAEIFIFPNMVFGSQTLTGTWLTSDGSTHVQFTICEKVLCGKIIWLKEPIDPHTGLAWRDNLNLDDSLKSRKLLGLNIVTDITQIEEGHWKANLYNPTDGKTYTGNIKVLSNSKLELEGCGLAGLICQKEVWVHVDAKP